MNEINPISNANSINSSHRSHHNPIQSDQISELAKALCKVQAEVSGAKKGSSNPFFKSKYADLASIIEASKAALAKNGLAVTQWFSESNENTCRVCTTLMHESGQFLTSHLDIPLVKKDPQAMGSAITYGRRYSLAAILNMAQIDDDAESSLARGVTNRYNNTQGAR
tara:strand:- start:1513 stop:2013 length:501 start_codon:yes stop_codon:yes gene_type:complete